VEWSWSTEPPFTGGMRAQFFAITLGNRTAGEELFSLGKLPFVDVFLIIETIRLPSSSHINRIPSKRRYKRLLP
jgi:hypothetical protein